MYIVFVSIPDIFFFLIGGSKYFETHKSKTLINITKIMQNIIIFSLNVIKSMGIKFHNFSIPSNG